MPPEIPIKCDNCGSEDLIHGLKFGKLNSVMGNMGGPGQEPMPMGTQWSVYLCVQCEAVLPYKRHYAAQPQIQAQYEKVYKSLNERLQRKKELEEANSQLESVRESRKTLAVLPGAMGSNEAQISAAIAPVYERLEQMAAEMRKRKGGRPRKHPIKERP